MESRFIVHLKNARRKKSPRMGKTIKTPTKRFSINTKILEIQKPESFKQNPRLEKIAREESEFYHYFGFKNIYDRLYND